MPGKYFGSENAREKKEGKEVEVEKQNVTSCRPS